MGMRLQCSHKLKIMLNKLKEFLCIIAIAIMLLIFRQRYVGAIDFDGVNVFSNHIKDECLDPFCEQEMGKIPEGKLLPTQIHRKMHGKPMGCIFQAISKDIYGVDMDEKTGIDTTELLNTFIREPYANAKEIPGANRVFRILSRLMPLYILTGMEPYMTQANLDRRGIKFFKGIFGAPYNKEENVKTILAKHPKANILGFGDAMSEYQATMAYKGTIFVAVDFENRPKRVFPPEVPVYKKYDWHIWYHIMKHMWHNIWN